MWKRPGRVEELLLRSTKSLAINENRIKGRVQLDVLLFLQARKNYNYTFSIRLPTMKLPIISSYFIGFIVAVKIAFH